MTTLLFLCTGNSARSQIAEGFARARALSDVRVLSAGTQPAERVHPVAVEVMAEVGIDISACRPKALPTFAEDAVDVSVALCSQAAQECAMLLPGHPPQVSWDLIDPPTR
jgi:arsenate reductase